MASIVKAHLPCNTCGSHDALCTYSDGSTYCFSCNTCIQKGDNDTVTIPQDSLVISSLKKRGITKATCHKYGYYISKNAKTPMQVACYYDDNGECIGKKIRYPDKHFAVEGTISHRFFGQHLWANGHMKKLVITEGEIDCLTVSQLQENKYPCVSIPNGAASAKKVFKENMEWLNTFEEVIVMFDMDEAGRKAVEDVQGLLKPRKLKIANLPLKDPNECLIAGRGQEVILAIWNAKAYKPDGIINGKDTWELISKAEEETKCYEFPWETLPLNKMTLGMRKGELLILTAGTGVGKTTFIRQIAYDLGVKKKLKIGMLMLEENIKRTIKGLMSVASGKRLYINRQGLSDKEYKRCFDAVMGNGNYILYEHFGSLSGENLMDKIRYMTLAEQCDFIILDHISIAISGLEGDNERKLIDILMTQMRSLVEETGVGMLVISHLRRLSNESTSHEEGGATSLSQLRGSGAIAQLADTVIGLERNQQAQGMQRNMVRIRVLKNRYTGETGIAGYLQYSKETDRLTEVKENENPMLNVQQEQNNF